MSSAKKKTTRKRGVRRRRPGWNEEKEKEAKKKVPEITTKRMVEIEKIQEEKQVEETKKQEQQVAEVREAQRQKAYRIGSQKNPIPVKKYESEILEAFMVFFQTSNQNDIFIKSEQTIKLKQRTLKAVYAEGPKGNKVMLWFDISSLSAF